MLYTPQQVRHRNKRAYSRERKTQPPGCVNNKKGKDSDAFTGTDRECQHIGGKGTFSGDYTGIAGHQQTEYRNIAADLLGGQKLVQEYQQDDSGRNPEQPGKRLPHSGCAGQRQQQCQHNAQHGSEQQRTEESIHGTEEGNQQAKQQHQA